MRRKTGFLCICLLLLVWPAGAMAVTFDQVVAFGDSLSDNTNVPGAPYTDDDVWVQYLANDLGVPLINLAYAGAKAAPDFTVPLGVRPPSLVEQSAGFIAGSGGFWPPGALDASYDNTLFTVWAGGNDLLAATDPTSAAAAIDRAVKSVGLSLGMLAWSGAKDIMVVNMPDFGLIPAYYQTPYQSFATGMSMQFNQGLQDELYALEHFFDATFYYVDVFGLIQGVEANPGKYGLSSVAQIFWDAIHPNSIGHHLIADLAYGQLETVQEPATFVMVGAALVMLAAVNRRRRFR